MIAIGWMEFDSSEIRKEDQVRIVSREFEPPFEMTVGEEAQAKDEGPQKLQTNALIVNRYEDTSARVPLTPRRRQGPAATRGHILCDVDGHKSRLLRRTFRQVQSLVHLSVERPKLSDDPARGTYGCKPRHHAAFSAAHG
ncbi:MAG: hypothetical protein JSS02_27395 [Planctomycetes bacterium]|nr:hypothetical protein [Planctomycetota bacterium]